MWPCDHVTWWSSSGPHARYTMLTVHKGYYGKLLKCMKKVIYEKNNVDQNPPSGHDFSAFFMLKNSPRCVFLGGKKSCCYRCYRSHRGIVTFPFEPVHIMSPSAVDIFSLSSLQVTMQHDHHHDEHEEREEENVERQDLISVPCHHPVITWQTRAQRIVSRLSHRLSKCIEYFCASPRLEIFFFLFIRT